MSNGETQAQPTNLVAQQTTRGIGSRAQYRRAIARRMAERPATGRPAAQAATASPSPVATASNQSQHAIQQLAALARNTEVRFEQPIPVPGRLSIPLGSPFGYKIRFRVRLEGRVEISAGSRNPELELAIARSGISLEQNIELREGLQLAVQRDLVSLEDTLVQLLVAQLAPAVDGEGELSARGLLVQSMQRTVSLALKAESVEIKATGRPSFRVIPPSISFSFAEAEMQIGSRKLFDLQLFSIPIRARINGYVLVEFGVSLIGWRDIAYQLANQLARRSSLAAYVRYTQALNKVENVLARFSAFARNAALVLLEIMIEVAWVFGLLAFTYLGLSAIGQANIARERRLFIQIFCNVYAFDLYALELADSLHTTGRFQPTTRRARRALRADRRRLGTVRLREVIRQAFADGRRTVDTQTAARMATRMADYIEAGGGNPSEYFIETW